MRRLLKKIKDSSLLQSTTDYRRDIDDPNKEVFWDQVKTRFLNYAYDDDVDEEDFENPENWQRVLDGEKLLKHADE